MKIKKIIGRENTCRVTQPGSSADGKSDGISRGSGVKPDL